MAVRQLNGMWRSGQVKMLSKETTPLRWRTIWRTSSLLLDGDFQRVSGAAVIDCATLRMYR